MDKVHCMLKTKEPDFLHEKLKELLMKQNSLLRVPPGNTLNIFGLQGGNGLLHRFILFLRRYMILLLQ